MAPAPPYYPPPPVYSQDPVNPQGTGQKFNANEGYYGQNQYGQNQYGNNQEGIQLQPAGKQLPATPECVPAQ